ncbi:porin family protein [Meridianimarinicoccus roseus]|uniref:Porin family protein n=1 Tax=Meridianimarinicoccus roseus TaxID=2072018 RepID=A0A2V2LJT9_9RHOB|nr:outer membrane beta-barrel protein [Meridianimarinicoccus roseus]PWR03476.1 porin family protein [Meridianimarinicoccus roseus]
MSSQQLRLASLAFGTALVAAGGTTAAFAGSLDQPQPEVAPAPVVTTAPLSRWSGGYAGAQIGYGYADTDTTQDGDVNNNGILDTAENLPSNTLNTLRNIGEDGDGATGGVHAGYLLNSGNFVYGGEADYDFSDIQFDRNAGEVNGIGRLKLKGGYDLGNTLVYATAGAAYADADIAGSGYNDWGWVGGIGAEYLLTDNVSVGAEALYNDFGEFDNSDTDVSLTTVSARVSYRF